MSIITIRGAGAPLWDLVWNAIRAHEAVYTTVAQQATEPGAVSALRSFFRVWDPIYVRAMEIQARGGSVSEDQIRRLVRAFDTARQAAWRIGLGRDDRGAFHPKLNAETVRALRAYRTYGPVPLTVAGEAMSAVPSSFRACIQACINEEQILYLSCDAGGKQHHVSIDLKPIAAQVKEMIRRYHVHVLHGDMALDTISGLGDWYRSSVRAAARIAHAKAAKKLWAQVKAHHGMIEDGLSAIGPFGTAAKIGIRTGLTVQKMLSKAKEGDPVAVADVRAIVSLSKQGDPSAKQVTEMMRAMNEMGKIKDEKAPVDIAGWLWNRPYRVAAVSPDMALRGLYNLGLAS